MKQSFKNQPESNVLVVDDSTVNLQLVGSILIDNGIKPFFSTSARHALTFLEDNIPDLILLDISMPEMDGYEMCKLLKSNKRTEHVPVIFFTARTQPEEIVTGFEVGGVDYITKPFNKAELIMRITTHINLKKALDIIKQQNIELNNLNEAKDRMLAIIAHDLRGPVGNFKEITDVMLSMKDHDGAMDELLTLLKDSATSTYILLENLLNWSQSQRNKITVEHRKFQMSECIKPVVAMYASEAKIKNLELSYAGNLKIDVMADFNMVSVIMRNLISNAIAYTPDGGAVIVSVNLRGNKVETSVTNTGKFLNPDEIKKIMDPLVFYTTREGKGGGGSGLGIKLCLEFVRKNNGTMWVESDPGCGTSFHFTLPMP